MSGERSADPAIGVSVEPAAVKRSAEASSSVPADELRTERTIALVLYLIAVIAVALRFDLLETLGAALGIALVYVVSMSAVGGLAASSLIARPSLMVITGFAVGVLAEQRRLHAERQRALE